MYEDFNTSNITSKLILENSDSYVIYNVDVYNLGNVLMGIKSFNANQDNLKLEVLNYNLKTKLCDEENKCTLGAKKTIQLKVSYKDGAYNEQNTSYDMQVDFDFARIYSVNYKNIDSENLVTEVMEGETLLTNLPSNGNYRLRVTMDNKVLSTRDGYSYVNNILTVPNVTGDINVFFQGKDTIMRKKIIQSYAPSGNEDDLTSYEIGSMIYEDRKKTFGNIGTTPGLYRTDGITGASDVLVFRGNVTNNHVKFAGYDWRILQVDEDGNLRLILDDALKNSSKYNATSTIPTEADAETVLSYQNSFAKERLTNWTTYLTPWLDKVIPSNFCNDFTYETRTSSSSKNETHYFKSYINVGMDSDKYTPNLTCSTNAMFQSDIGLISAEEYVLAGGAFTKANTQTFIYNADIDNDF